ncbi:TonB-dependent receptor [Granulicella sp. dw_53]|uniref:TonB-dependent receptor n=1 Tax=Granulicella sp. dw_53 TaxID=2719792 RepID=UPI001BD3B948|nr:TonB-dependent receptor [Granulicella sp. dw_53]
MIHYSSALFLSVLFPVMPGYSQISAPSGFGLVVLVEDSTGAVLPNASVSLRCPGQREQQAVRSVAGTFTLPLSVQGCVLQVQAEGFAPLSQIVPAGVSDVELRLVPVRAEAQVTVLADQEIATAQTTSAHGVLSARQIADIPITNHATGLTEILTRTTPGVAADANGFAHPLGEHADTSLSLDGQPITDQQAKVFANQIDPAIIQTLKATTGAPTAEFGDKTSLIVEITTKSGRDHKPSGSLSSEYGSFGSWSEALSFSVGSKAWGNFLAVNGGGSNRFLDTPEFDPIHAHGNSEGLFDRVDFQPRERDLLHLNMGLGRSWFQTPNSFDTAAAAQDRRSQIRNSNLAFGWTHTVSPSLLLTFTPFLRHDRAEYVPSADPLADFTATMAQDRTLTNTGLHAQALYIHGPHTAKVGGTYTHTLLHERFSLALTDPVYNSPCMTTAGGAAAAPGIRSPGDCTAVGLLSNPAYLPALLPYDLTRGGGLYHFDKSADIVQTAFYAQDEVHLGDLLLSAGLRYDIYDGLSRGRQLAPRLGAGWRTPFTRTLLRLSYARLYETPYNENLIFANESGAGDTGVGTGNPFAAFRSEPVRPGTRNQFNVGVAQSFGSHVTVDADYYWKFTHTAFDFDTLFNTPITFSVAWRKSKIDGLAVRLAVSDLHGFNVSSVMGHVRSRFFTPEVGGLIFNPAPSSPVFRIDHGEEFEQTTNFRYDFPRRVLGRHRLWAGAVWRYNSGLALPDTVPTHTEALALTPDEQSQIGLHCGADRATPTHAIRSCGPAAFATDRIRIPAPGTYDADRNAVRVSPRTLIDLSVGDDGLHHFEHATLGVRATVINAANEVALYNFLSTFSGTHFVPPRAVQLSVQLTF